MDIKKWAGTKLGMGAPPGAAATPGGFPPPAAGAPAPGGFPPAGAMGAGMYGPPSTPLFNTEITSAALPPTMAQWAQAGGTAPQHPMGPPAWASDQGAFSHAQALVQKDWEAYKEPWAVVALLYDAMAGAAGPAAGAPPGPPKPPMPGAPPGGAPKPPGAPPGAKPPGFPPKPGGFPKPGGA